MALRNNPLLLMALASLAGCMDGEEGIYSFKESGCEMYYVNISNKPELDAKINIDKGDRRYLIVKGVSMETLGVEAASWGEGRVIPGTSDSGCLFFSRAAKIYAKRYNKYVSERLSTRR